MRKVLVNDIDVFVLCRRGAFYGFFLTDHLAKDFGEFLASREQQKQYADVKGEVHQMKLSDCVRKMGGKL